MSDDLTFEFHIKRGRDRLHRVIPVNLDRFLSLRASAPVELSNDPLSLAMSGQSAAERDRVFSDRAELARHLSAMLTQRILDEFGRLDMLDGYPKEPTPRRPPDLDARVADSMADGHRRCPEFPSCFDVEEDDLADLHQLIRDLHAALKAARGEEVSPELRMERMADERSVRHTPCDKCGATGVRVYGSTARWRGGIGGRAMTPAQCDVCWGSGDSYRPWVDLRALEARERGSFDAWGVYDERGDLWQIHTSLDDVSYDADMTVRRVLCRLAPDDGGEG